MHPTRGDRWLQFFLLKGTRPDTSRSECRQTTSPHPGDPDKDNRRPVLQPSHIPPTKRPGLSRPLGSNRSLSRRIRKRPPGGRPQTATRSFTSRGACSKIRYPPGSSNRLRSCSNPAMSASNRFSAPRRTARITPVPVRRGIGPTDRAARQSPPPPEAFPLSDRAG